VRTVGTRSQAAAPTVRRMQSSAAVVCRSAGSDCAVPAEINPIGSTSRRPSYRLGADRP
jgi:hypothetical protein